MIGNICPVCGMEIPLFRAGGVPNDFKQHVKDHWEKDNLGLSLSSYVRAIYANPPCKSKEAEG